ncbi:hypothetical protein DERF_015050 [Dermatophagoides farinae]|uniref:Uncharacterized protein n=1 Tax=Dermatophagoides farinae TaxID=6954 RepID=A0A922HQG9_DERFA|nr:hypothetical protein DERF_015050 [Dermatophagoides farinae]
MSIGLSEGLWIQRIIENFDIVPSTIAIYVRTTSYECTHLLAGVPRVSDYIRICNIKRNQKKMGTDPESIKNLGAKSTIKIAENGPLGESKHIDTRAHAVKDYIDRGFVKLLYLKSELMLADFLTIGSPL